MSLFPANEISEAWKLLEQEFKALTDTSTTTTDATASDTQTTTIITDDIIPDTPTTNATPTMTVKRKREEEIAILFSKRQKVEKNEFTRWKEEAEVPYSDNVLQWWKCNRERFPTISRIARKYLAFPASQATTERSFSTAKRVVTPSRSSLSPSRIGKLVVWHQAYDIFSENK